MIELLLAVVISPVALAQLPVESPTAAADRQERLQYMKDKAAKFTLSRESSPDQPFRLKEEPILRFSNPERDSGTWDGATFLWLEGTRPTAAICFGIRRPSNAVFREHTSLTSDPLVCQKASGTAWAPQTGGLLDREMPSAPHPADNAQGRLNQMRSLARRFSATCYYKEDATQLRLMPQPLYRYADEKQRILDGALFALVVSNDAEMFLTLEAVAADPKEKPKWRYSLARMSSLKHTIRLDDQEIWTIPGYYTIPPVVRKTSPYIEAFEGNFMPSAEPPPAK